MSRTTTWAKCGRKHIVRDFMQNLELLHVRKVERELQKVDVTEPVEELWNKCLTEIKTAAMETLGQAKPEINKKLHEKNAARFGAKNTRGVENMYKQQYRLT